MLEKHWIELIHREIDGLNTPEESSLLKAYLAEHPDQNQLFTDLQDLTTMFNTVERADPSPTLKTKILDNIMSRLNTPHDKTDAAKRIPGVLRFGSRFGVGIRYAAMFAGGFAVSTILFFVYLSSSRPELAGDSSAMQGAMGLSEQRRFEEADHARITGPEMSGGIQVQYNKDIVQARLDLSSKEPVDVNIEFDEDVLTFGGMLLLTNPELNRMTVGPHDVTLKHDGERQYRFIFTKKASTASSLTLKISGAGSVVFETSLLTGGPARDGR